MRTNKITTVVSILLIAVYFLSSCGDKKAKKEEVKEEVKKEVVKVEEKKEPVKEEKVIEGALYLAGDDNMKFDKSELRVKAGDKVTLVLKHVGKMPAKVMGHNFVLLKKGTDVPKFATKAIAASATDYIPEGDEVIAYTKMLGGGETDTITFDAPAKGTYDFICSFPGHYGIMKGKFIVE